VTTNGTTFTRKFIKIQPVMSDLKHVNISTDWADVHTHMVIPVYTVLVCKERMVLEFFEDQRLKKLKNR